MAYDIMAKSLKTLVIIWASLLVVTNGQSIGVASNIYDSLQPLQCTQFLAILNKCRESVRRLYRDDVQWTVFVPSDNAFNVLPAERRNQFNNMTQEQAENYILAFTLIKALQSTFFVESRPEQSRSPLNTKIFLTKRARREDDVATAGIAGPTEYYANGARIVRPDIPAGKSLIHVIDRVLEAPSDKSLLAHVKLGHDTAFYDEILNYIPRGESYTLAIEPLNTQELLTILVPTREAIRRMPGEFLDLLRINETLLTEVVKKHIVPNHVLYTSFLYDGEDVPSLSEQGSIRFRISSDRGRVLVSSGGVAGEITHGNITAKNGVVHYVDTVLGYKYKTAREEIDLNPLTQTFKDLLQLAGSDLQTKMMAPSGLTIFVPTNNAFENVLQFYSLASNVSLINTIIEQCMLELGQEYELARLSQSYEDRLSLTSSHFRRPVEIYKQGRDYWIESGHVKARVNSPDVGVLNGYIHLIDAVPGLPTRDVPNTIFCEDWLIKPAYHFHLTGLNQLMRDPRVTTVAPCTKPGGVQTLADVHSAFLLSSMQQLSTPTGQPDCNTNCIFTFFVPNGTAIEFFEQMPVSRQIQENLSRWRWVLERHITKQEIYLDQVPVGAERSYTALNGDTVRYRRYTDRYAFIYYRGKEAKVLHSDLGGTNGVIHIVDKVLFVAEDATRNTFD